MEINLLGYTVEEALGEVDKFIDSAVLRNQQTIYIIHGIGTGALRTGGREASRHLDIPVLSREEERAASTGVEVVRGALRALLAAGADIRPGSGAPGVGLAPGLAQHEESELFRAGGASTEGEGAGG